jgi:tetrapyrrole methylase family protein/MazG family protein
LTEESKATHFNELKAIIARLRSSEGCPWDRQQTHESLRPFLIEESYEVLQAIEEGTPPKLCEELGDLLLQIMLHAQISSESGQFTVEDVIRGISDKLIHRLGGFKKFRAPGQWLSTGQRAQNYACIIL